MHSCLSDFIGIQSGTLARDFNDWIVKCRRAAACLCFYTESTHRKLFVFQAWLDECSSHDGLFSGCTRNLLIDAVVTNGQLVRNYNFLAVCRACWEKNVSHGAFSPWIWRRKHLIRTLLALPARLCFRGNTLDAFIDILEINCPLVSQSLGVLPSKELEYQKQQAAGLQKALHEVVKPVNRQLSPWQSGLLFSTTASPPASMSPSTGRPATAMARSSTRGTSGSAPASSGSPRSCLRSSAWSSPPCCPCSAWWFFSE